MAFRDFGKAPPRRRKPSPPRPLSRPFGESGRGDVSAAEVIERAKQDAADYTPIGTRTTGLGGSGYRLPSLADILGTDPAWIAAQGQVGNMMERAGANRTAAEGLLAANTSWQQKRLGELAGYARGDARVNAAARGMTRSGATPAMQGRVQKDYEGKLYDVELARQQRIMEIISAWTQAQEEAEWFRIQQLNEATGRAAVNPEYLGAYETDEEARERMKPVDVGGYTGPKLAKPLPPKRKPKPPKRPKRTAGGV